MSIQKQDFLNLLNKSRLDLCNCLTFDEIKYARLEMFINPKIPMILF